ncbi:MAG: hypothetical protein IKI19_03925 [Prevotella sp.]|nr:hypothetical protein [Prevotella sp.]MBR6997936.1 hypothetical protein [Prevotella sp.]
MANFTKEQAKLYTWIGSAVLLFIWLFIPSMKMSFMGFSESFVMPKGLSDLGFHFTIIILLLLLCPLYLLLYSFKEKLPGLKPIFVLDRKIAGIVLAAVAAIFVILLFITKPDGIPFSPAFGAWLYLIIAGGICYLGLEDK